MKHGLKLAFLATALLLGIVVFAQGGDLQKGNPAQTLEQRLAQLESRQAILTARVNDLETEILRGRKPPEPLQYPGLDGKLRKLALVSKGGSFLVLDDASGWETRPDEMALTNRWKEGDTIVVFKTSHETHPYILVNRDQKYAGAQPEAVRCAYMMSKGAEAPR